VLVLVPRHDAFITPAVFDDLTSFAPAASTVEIDGGHWVMRQQPARVAQLIADHVRAHV
jgi:pimeloyl-ACP methyl ester carboxylesterase